MENKLYVVTVKKDDNREYILDNGKVYDDFSLATSRCSLEASLHRDNYISRSSNYKYLTGLLDGISNKEYVFSVIDIETKEVKTKTIYKVSELI